jgi:hypothetical protein
MKDFPPIPGLSRSSAPLDNWKLERLFILTQALSLR